MLPGRNGAFADMPAKIGGPVVVSHTRNDKAVGMAYAIAARLAGHVGVDLGDANDMFGGMGSNGAQRTPGRRLRRPAAGRGARTRSRAGSSTT